MFNFDPRRLLAKLGFIPTILCIMLKVEFPEINFAPDGNTPYYMLYTLTDDPEGSICSVSISSFHFPSNFNELEEDLHRCRPSQHTTYRISKSVKELLPTFILTHWTTKYLYIALPILSSRPKIVRLGLTFCRRAICGISDPTKPTLFSLIHA